MVNRKVAPKLSTITHIPLISPEILTLENGAKIYTIRESNDATVRVDFVFNAGSAMSTGIASDMTAELLLSGTDTQSSEEIDEKIDTLGGYTDVKAATEKTSVTVFGLLEFIVPITEIVIDAVKNATFHEKELKQAISENKKRLEIRLKKGKTMAQRTFIKHLLEGSPYADIIELEDFKNCSRESLVEFHRDVLLKSLSHINIVGAVSEEQLNAIKELGNQFSCELNPDLKYEIENRPKTIHIAKEGALQTAVRIGKMMFNKTHPDFKKLAVVNTILGGYFGSRLMTSIREEKGYTYGIGAGTVQLKETGYFYISSEVAAEHKDATIAAIKEEIEILQTEKVGAEELELVKSYLIGQLLESSDGAQSMMDRFHSTHYFGLTLSYYDDLIKTINEITPEEIQFYANEYLKWEDMSIVTVG